MEGPLLLRQPGLRRLAGAGLCLTLLGAALPVRMDGPFRGKVLDADTKEPLEGAVAIVVWHRPDPTTLGHTGIFVEAFETLTDPQGEFTLPAFTSVNPSVEPPNFRIFKPGYGSYPKFHTRAQGTLRDSARQPAVVELPKLKTREERLKVYDAICLGLARVPDQKIPNVVRLNTIEAQGLGLIKEGKTEGCFSPAR